MTRTEELKAKQNRSALEQRELDNLTNDPIWHPLTSEGRKARVDTPSTLERRIAELEAREKNPKDDREALNDEERRELADLRLKLPIYKEGKVRKDADRAEIYARIGQLNDDEWSSFISLIRQHFTHLFTNYATGVTRYPGGAYKVETPEEKETEKKRREKLTADEEKALRDSEKLGGVKHVR